MSFEGYYQVLCPAGHYDEHDWLAVVNYRSECKCEECGAEAFQWSSLVNTTNTDDDWNSIVDLTPYLVTENGGQNPPIYLLPSCEVCEVKSISLEKFCGAMCCEDCIRTMEDNCSS